jgi:hypothetical protein
MLPKPIVLEAAAFQFATGRFLRANAFGILIAGRNSFERARLEWGEPLD